MKENSLLQIRVVARKQLSSSLIELVFEGDNGLPAAEPGSHVDVYLPNGLVRQYSLVDHVIEGGRYRIGVRVLSEGRGGSRCVADSLQEGQTLAISTPRNLFPLKPEDRPIVLVAGGIGITPVHSMGQWLRENNHQNWLLHYVFSQQEETYFPSEWLLQDERVRLYETNQTEERLDLNRLVSGLEVQGGDVYCCGPTGLMEALSARCARSPLIRYVQETFVAPEPLTSEAGAFTVVLAQSGQTLQVASNQTILEALQLKGVDVPYSCGQGICGACETNVLEGMPEHRDAILSEGEKKSGSTMMICCSRSLTPSLTLDL